MPDRSLEKMYNPFYMLRIPYNPRTSYKKIRIILYFSLALSLLGCTPAYSGNSSSDDPVARSKSYFLLVYSSYDNQIDRIDSAKLKVLSQSPYNGIAIRVANEFDDRVIQWNKLENKAKFIKQNTSKTIWPWVFLNRMIGNNDKTSIRDVIKNKPYFLTIKGMDIYDDQKALTDFYNLWRYSLRIARTLSSPGVVFDMEPYNNNMAYNLEYLAGKHDKSKEEIRRQLRIIGAELTRIASEEYSDAVIWFLFTYIGYPEKKMNPFITDDFYTVSYIAEGMIQEAEKRNLRMKFVDGGEVGIGYCFKSQEDMRRRIKVRREKLKTILEKHSSFYLGGTIAPWNDVKDKRGWMNKGICLQGNMKTVDDFCPLIRILSSEYDYIWIYATPVSGYNPFDKEISSPFNKGLQKAFQK